MKKIILPAIAIATILFYVYQQNQKNSKSVPTVSVPEFGQVSEFSLINQANETFNSTQMLGKVWLVSFMFTTCHGPCPMMNQKMAALQNDLIGLKNFHQVSISMDPETDTPEQLRAYGKKFQSEDSRWTFLTGEKAKIISIAKDIFKLPAGEDPNMHSTRFVLIDQKGKIRGYFDSLSPDALIKLREQARLLHDSDQKSS